MLWTKALGLNLKQSEVDFLIPELDHDLNLYVDPLLFYRSSHPEYQAVHACLHEFFSIAIEKVRAGKITAVEKMLIFPEVNETMLGMAKKNHTGRGMGAAKGQIILEEIIKNVDVQKNGITHIAELQLLIEGVGYDLVSDMCTNIAKVFFVKYTQQQCKLHDIELEKNLCLSHVFDWDTLTWDDIFADLPTNPNTGDPILLVPRDVVRRFPIFDHAGFWNTTYRYILRNTMLDTSVHAIGKIPKIPWKDVSSKFDSSKKAMVEVLHKHPELRHEYVDMFESNLKTSVNPVDLLKIQGVENHQTPIKELIAELENIKPGNEHAKAYERLILRVLTRLFSPYLTSPESQVYSHDNREIVDITFYNSAHVGFWSDVKQLWRSQVIMFELKNMEDLGNEEFFQLSARLNDVKGMFGILISRKKDHLDMQRAYRRLSSERKVTLVITDEDVINMLNLEGSGKDATQYLQGIYRTYIDEL